MKRLLLFLILGVSLAQSQAPYYSRWKGIQIDSAVGTVRNMRFYNVKDFGAIGDGIIDDRISIQAAIDAAAVNGGEVYVPPGTYRVTGISHPIYSDWKVCLLIKSGVTFRGAGAGQSIIKRDANQANKNTIMYNYRADIGDNNITIEDIEFDGNSANNPASVDTVQYGVAFWRVSTGKFKNVTVRGVRGTNPDGVTESVCYSAVYSSHLTYENCTAVGDSVSVTGFSNDGSVDIHYTDCVSYGHVRGIGFTHNASQNIIYTGCASYNNGGHGFNSEYATNAIYVNCIAGGVINYAGPYPYTPYDTLGNGWSGFRISASTGPVSLANCIGSYNDSSGIIVEGYSTSVNIIAGRFDYNNQYGVYIYWAQDDYAFSANPVAVGNDLGPLNIMGSTGYTSIPNITPSLAVNRTTVGPAKMAVGSTSGYDSTMIDLYKPAGGVMIGLSNDLDFKAVIGIDTLKNYLGFGTHSQYISELVLRDYKLGINTENPDSNLTNVGGFHNTGGGIFDGPISASNTIGSNFSDGHLVRAVTVDSLADGPRYVDASTDTAATRAYARTAYDTTSMANQLSLKAPKASPTFTGVVANYSATTSAPLILGSGDGFASSTMAQIRLAYQGTADYAQFIATEANGGSASGNKIKFYTSDGTATPVFPSTAILGFTVEQGNVYTPGIVGAGGATMDSSFSGTGIKARGIKASGSITAADFRLSALNTAPSSASDTGTLGEIRIASGYIYVCTATNTWVRAQLSTW